MSMLPVLVYNLFNNRTQIEHILVQVPEAHCGPLCGGVCAFDLGRPGQERVSGVPRHGNEETCRVHHVLNS